MTKKKKAKKRGRKPDRLESLRIITLDKMIDAQVAFEEWKAAKKKVKGSK